MAEKLMEKTWLPQVEAIIEKNLYGVKKDGDTYYSEIYVDYNDKYLSDTTVKEILKAVDPRTAFYEKISEWEINQYPYEVEYVEKTIKENLDEETYDRNWDEITDWIREHFYFVYNPNDFSADVCVDILMDTGDLNEDFTPNCTYPHYNGQFGETINDTAAILWLAKQQGYSKRQVNKALRHQIFDGSKFLKSLYEEVLNCTSHMNVLTFLVSLSLDEAFDLMDAYKAEEKVNQSYTLSERKGRGYLTLKKETTCGLYDPFTGAGSLLGIELEKDVEIPFRCIDSLLPDGGRGYSIQEIYGCFTSEWTVNALQKVVPMEPMKRSA